MDHQNNTTNHATNLVVYYWTNLASAASGNSLDQQKEDFTNWIAQQQEKHQGSTWNVAAEFTDKHLKRTKPKHFPELIKAVNHSVQQHAKLIIVKLDGLISQKEFSELLATPNLDFICVDKPLVTPGALSVVRQYVEDQSKQHGANIKRGLRLTTNKLGNPNAAKAITPFNKIKTENSVLFALLLQPIIAQYQQQGLSQRKMVTELNEAGILAPEGGKWVLSQLQKVLKRIDANNLAIDLSHEIKQHDYQSYSADELIQKLNHSTFKPQHQEAWDESTITAAKHRNETIVNVLELYEFLQKHEHQINDSIATGNSLEVIANELNSKKLSVPRALFDETNVSSGQHLWNQDLVEKLIKRMTNELKLPYNQVILKDFSDAIERYVNNTDNDTIKEVYGHHAMQHLLHHDQASGIRITDQKN